MAWRPRHRMQPLHLAMSAARTKRGKKAAFAAVLNYLGVCREYFARLPEIRRVAVPHLAKALQKHDEDLLASPSACQAVVSEGAKAAIEERMQGRDPQEMMTVKWMVEDRAHVPC